LPKLRRIGTFFTVRRYSKRAALWFVFALASVGSSAAQEGQFVDSYATSEAVDGSRTVFLLAIGAGTLEPTTPYSAAAVEQATLTGLEQYATEKPISLSELAFLVSRYFDIRPGLMGRLFPSPRYALRDLRREKIVLYDVDAAAPVPGAVALRTIGRGARWESSR